MKINKYMCSPFCPCGPSDNMTPEEFDELRLEVARVRDISLIPIDLTGDYMKFSECIEDTNRPIPDRWVVPDRAYAIFTAHMEAMRTHANYEEIDEWLTLLEAQEREGSYQKGAGFCEKSAFFWHLSYQERPT